MAYLGQSLTEGTRRVYNYVATASQTTFNAVYGVGAVDVYQNGVLLSEADYVATTGTTVVLGTGAAVNDEITIACHNTFSVADTYTKGEVYTQTEADAEFVQDPNGAITVSGSNVGIGVSPPAWSVVGPAVQVGNAAVTSYSSGSIRFTYLYNNAYFNGTNDTYIGSGEAGMYQMVGGSHRWFSAPSGTAGGAATLTERLRIDGSGNLLVGQTTANSTVVGMSLRPSGEIVTTRDGANAISLNRKTSDGDIALFKKDGSTVGSIGTQGGDKLTIGNGDVGVAFNPNADSIYPWNTATNAARDAGVDLGYSDGGSTNIRFRDLYLSGGVYLGGTSSANKLDDYEYGRFTPSMDATSVTYNARQGDYVKIGKLVNIYVFVNWSAISGWNGNISGLPFTQSSLDTFYPMGQVFNNNGVSYPSGRSTILAYVNDGTSQMTVATVGSAVNAAAPALSTSGYMHISLTYITA